MRAIKRKGETKKELRATDSGLITSRSSRGKSSRTLRVSFRPPNVRALDKSIRLTRANRLRDSTAITKSIEYKRVKSRSERLPKATLTFDSTDGNPRETALLRSSVDNFTCPTVRLSYRAHAEIERPSSARRKFFATRAYARRKKKKRGKKETLHFA